MFESLLPGIEKSLQLHIAVSQLQDLLSVSYRIWNMTKSSLDKRWTPELVLWCDDMKCASRNGVVLPHHLCRRLDAGILTGCRPPQGLLKPEQSLLCSHRHQRQEARGPPWLSTAEAGLPSIKHNSA